MMAPRPTPGARASLAAGERASRPVWRTRMALVTCPDCERSVSDSAPSCPGCGRPMQNATPAALAAAPESGSVLRPILATASVALVLLAVGLGNFHVVSGAEGRVFVKRVSFGYEDSFGSVSDCTSGPWVVAAAQHGKLCRALQDAGILESDADRDARVQREVQQQMERIQADVQRQTDAMMRQLSR
jgi:hypothetical protein